MTATGSPALWQLADAFDVIPAPPTSRLARVLADWWRVPRRFGCASAKTFGAVWCVVAPDVRVWCVSCAAERFESEGRCCYCSEPVPDDGLSLTYEMRSVHVLARAHQRCHEGGDG